jgi:hypothetical protein
MCLADRLFRINFPRRPPVLAFCFALAVVFVEFILAVIAKIKFSASLLSLTLAV